MFLYCGNVYRQDDPAIEPTNNRAERALRGAVIARSVSHCSNTDGGAEAYSAFWSVIRTLSRRVDDESVLDVLPVSTRTSLRCVRGQSCSQSFLLLSFFLSQHRQSITKMRWSCANSPALAIV